ncbi:MAG: prolyl oligopeptidase family serine peptidase [Actinobacteria bacterium]|nr:prolyl oligopeptidase family serine peptidase [Actinomycetota bacterium]
MTTVAPASTLPLWQQRFHAVRYALPSWARHAPHRTAYTTNASGVRQLWSWDLRTGRHTQLTNEPTGVSWGTPTPDGAGVVWFDDDDGNEVGRFVVTPFDGGDATPLASELAPGWAAGISLRAGTAAIGRADDEGFAIAIVDDRGTRTIVERERPVSVGGLHTDATLLALSHTEHGDVLHPTVEVVDLEGTLVGAVNDGLGNTVDPAGWSPVAGDTRFALVVDRSGRRQAEVWDVATNERTACTTRLPGEVEVEDWWPDGSALLLAHEHQGRRSLLRYELVGGTVTPIDVGTGTVGGARVRPDGGLWYVFESSADAPTVRTRTSDRDDVLLSSAARAPGGTAATAIRYNNGDGSAVHAFVTVPDGDPPHPLVVDIHGGPHAQVGDEFDPFVQAWVDHGFAVLSPNYRGSTGYGKQWQDALEGDPGRPELVDVLAGRDHLVATGVADPDRIVLVGVSWGGYLVLQGIGTQPAAWSAAVATVPVADYLAAYEDESPSLRQFDRGLFGCTPDECPDLYRERSPITYVAQVRAPVLIITGANDTRCPRRQIDNYVAALRAHGVAHHYDVFEAGHGSMAIAENIRQQALSLDFVAEHLGTPPARR